MARLAWTSVIVVGAFSVAACGGKTNDIDGGDGSVDSGTSGDTNVTPLDAIGGDTTPPPFDGPPTVGIPPFDGPFPDTPVPPDGPVDTAPPDPSICDGLAAAICSSATSTCCTSRGSTYDESTCKSNETTYCNEQIAAVKGGKLTYDPSQLDACKAAWSSEVTKCSIFFTDWVKMNAPCQQLFNGTVAPGAACTFDYQCQASPGGSAYCNTTSKKCVSYVVVAAGAGCNFTGSTIHYCDTGYYCDTTSTTPTCTPQRALGDACDGPDDLSCGYLNVCDSTGHCVVGKPAGATCSGSALECASWTCTGGKCTDPNVELGDPSSGLCTP